MIHPEQLEKEILRWRSVRYSPKPVNNPSPEGYVDCIGFVRAVLIDVGAIPETVSLPHYDFRQSRFTSSKNLLELMSDTLQGLFAEVPKKSPQPGDIVVFQKFKAPDHVGILFNAATIAHIAASGLSLIHYGSASPRKLFRLK